MDDTNNDEVGSVVNRWVRRAYLALIAGVVGLLGLHNGAAWLQKARAAYRSSNRTIVRMDRAQRWQHLVLVLSFILLALTGFALRFPDSWLSWVFGSEAVRRWLHRVAGVVLLGVGAWHIGYVILSARGRQLWRDLQFRRQDWEDLKLNARHLAGRSKDRPRFGRFGYAERIEYWAVVWGTIIMGVTGLAIWLKVDVTQFLPRWVVDVATTIHYYEAILASLAIVVWHFYHVFFDPAVYPGNFAWLDGKVPAEWMKHEHPLDQSCEVKVETGVSSDGNNADSESGRSPFRASSHCLHCPSAPRDGA
jgi:formate dehydrogenase gamma subunit